MFFVKHMKRFWVFLHILMLCVLYIGNGVTAFADPTEVRSINHRGYNSIAPENTLPAFRLSKERNFDYVETDVSITKDGVPVCLHDRYFNDLVRYDDGSEVPSEIVCDISEMTYEEALFFDFGAKKGEEYKGTRIARFDDFLDLCAELNLHPYIELKKNGGYSSEKVSELVDMVDEKGLNGNVTWISFEKEYLEWVSDKDPTARLGYIAFKIPDALETAKELKLETNEVFLDCCVYFVPDEDVMLCKNAGIPLEAWSLGVESDDVELMKTLDPYIKGFTSNVVRYEDVFSADDDSLAGNTPGTTASENKPMNYSIEEREEWKIAYNHEVPFWGKQKIDASYFGKGFLIYSGDKAYSVTKIKVDKKKHRMQITGLQDADKETVKAIKKATRGKKGLPFTCNPYYVSDKDQIVVRKNKAGNIRSIKVQINDRLYKAKKNEWTYDEAGKIIMFKGNNLAGSHED